MPYWIQRLAAFLVLNQDLNVFRKENSACPAWDINSAVQASLAIQPSATDRVVVVSADSSPRDGEGRCSNSACIAVLADSLSPSLPIFRAFLFVLCGL